MTKLANNGKTVLISGGAGFIGSNLAESLLKENYKVLCLDNFSTGSKENVAGLMENGNFLLLNTDVTKRLSDIVLDSKIDYIFHLASPASPNEASPISYMNLPLETMDANSIGTRRLLRLAKKNQAKFLFASTSEIYGDPSIHPQTEDYWGNVNPIGPRACYDESKRFGEALTMVYLRKFHVDARIVRIFNTYGPGMNLRDGRAVVNFIVAALKNQPITIFGRGKQTRSLCYVSDMVDGLKKALFSPKTKGEVFNLGNPVEYTILQIANKIKKAVGSQSAIVYADLPDDDPRRRRPDISKAKKQLNWAPKVKFSQGLAKTIKFFQEKLKNEQ
ncbi:MAG: GDP-mannose 4,6-dehydratase [Candidatus Beckwithbacteria bacterium]|nr:GDP-mannose 4,6-dehydratase [Candidatus Beckwithbacteria bacterium]